MPRAGSSGDSAARPDGRARHLDRATFLALVVLDEAMEMTKAGRVPASTGLRLALAHLYAVGDRRREYFDREPYDSFWRLATQQDNTGSPPEDYTRWAMLLSNFNGIARAAGAPATPEFFIAVHDARRAAQKETGY